MKVELNPRLFEASSPLQPSRKPKGAADFSRILKEAISEVNRLQLEAEAAIKDFTVGKRGIHETMIAIEKADLSFQLMMQIRNKIIKAYEEVMRMQV
ncbi:MAG: flagellar hook-basal body complex protein FliE [Deltaproteobacteria bacterium]|nr:MAG: flagellar hook-basal body complex protein FliE [Deltaproteobacteria bacterium]